MPDKNFARRLEHVMNQDTYERSPDDIRFQFDVIKELAASVRELTNHMSRQQEQIAEALISLERIEAREHTEQIKALETKIELLETDYHRRVGRDGFIASIFKSPLVAWVVVAAGLVYTFLRDKI